jgi:tetratricopeptide (TPR) repeat protein
VPEIRSVRRFTLHALAIFAVALVVRLLHVWQIKDATFFTVLLGDARAYDEWARRIAAGDWIGTEVFYQAPLYPYFLGTLYSLFGRDLLVTRLVQAAVGSAACALIGLAAYRLFSMRTGLVAGLMLALYAPAIFFDGLIQKSVLDVFFVCLALFILSGIVTEVPREGGPHVAHAGSGFNRTVWTWLALGVAMGALSLTRENALLLAGVIGVWAVWRGRLTRRAPAGRARRARGPAERPLTTPVGALAAYAAGLAIVLAPVAIRNNYVGGGFYITTAQFGPNFFIGNNPRSDGTYQSLRFGRGSPEYERTDATELAEHALGRRLSPAEVSTYWSDRALDFITTRPAAWLALMARKFLLLWNAAEMLDTESQETYAEWSWPLRIGGWFGHFGLLVPLALFGVWTTWSDRGRLAVFYALAVAYAASVLMFYVFARYRFPLVPMLVLFAAPGAVALPAFIRSAPRRHLAAAAGAAAAVAIFVNWPVLSKTLMRAITENNLGTALQAEGRLDEAIARYRRAIELQPDYAPAFSNMGTALRARGDLDQAVATYERALAMRPDYPDAHYNLANALLDKNQPDKAAEHFRIALESIPGSAGVHNNLGIALADEGKVDEAISAFSRALTLDPRSARAHKNIGNALASRGQTEDAIRHLSQAVDISPNDPEVHYDLASVHLQAGRFAEAIAGFRRALALRPDSAPAHNNLGIALASEGHLDEAIAHFQQALKIDPGFPDAKKNLAIALEAKKQFGQ